VCDDAPAPEGSVKVYLLDGTYKFFETTNNMLVCELLKQVPGGCLEKPMHSVSLHFGTLHEQVKDRFGVPESDSFALYQVQRGTHFLLHEDAQVAEIKSFTDPRAKALGMRDKRPKLLLKKFLFTKHDEGLIGEKAFIHLLYIQVRKMIA